MKPSESVSQAWIDRLPKWAQSEINRLEREIAYWQEKARQATEGDTDTWLVEEDNVALPKDSTILFNQSDYVDGIMVQHAAHQPGAVEVHGRRGFVIIPRSSNVVWIKPEDR